MSSLRRIFRYMRAEAPTLTVAYVAMIVLGATTAFYAFLAGPALKFVFTGEIHDILRTSSGELRSVWRYIPSGLIAAVEGLDRMWALAVMPVLIVITSIIKGIAQTTQFYLLGRTSQRVLKRVREDAFRAILSQSPSFFSKRTHGDLLSRLTSDATLVEQAIFYGAAPVLREPLTVVFLLAFCFATDAKLALLTFVIVPLAVVPLARFARWLKRVSRRGQGLQGEINAVSYEALAGVGVVQAFGAEDYEQARIARAGLRYYRQMLTSYFIRAVRTPTMEVLGAFALAGLLAMLGYQVRQKGADPAHFISFFVAVVMMYDPLKKLGNVSDYLAQGAAAADRVFEIIDLPPAIADKADAQPIPRFAEAVRLEQVTFAYGTEPVLSGIDLEIPRGSMVALVGSSGSGKTTLANLLPRFYDVTGGRILVDGHDIRDVTVASLRATLSLVSQETFLFNATVGANIAYGQPEMPLEKIREAAAAAYATEFIEKLPDGFDTVIGERGMTLSGGQRQRLAIARALLKDTPLLILDEATSNLDIESERYVQQALDRLMQGRTSLVIAHRLSTVRRADLIAVLKDGRIVERGRHDELLAQGGEYARLYELQFADLDEGDFAAVGS